MKNIYINALNKVADVQVSSPSRPMIINIYTHFLRAFCSLSTTDGQYRRLYEKQIYILVKKITH